MELIAKKPFGSLDVDVWQGESGEMFMTAKQLGEAIGYADPQKGMDNLVDRNPQLRNKEFSVTLKLRGSDEKQYDTRLFNEDGIYEATMLARTDRASQFRSWIRGVLKDIRKTGGHVNNDDLFLETYLPFADEHTRTMFRTTLATVRQQNALIQVQRQEIDHKEHVIIGLVDEIDLATKRQILNRVVRKAGADKTQARWNELYKQFEMKYHLNLQRRLEGHNESAKPKLKNRLDYIDKVLAKLPELYEIACKLYEADVKELVAELYNLSRA
ncbi:BRO family protein [Gorillibacterium timonense]|uniref:BRO family protein n=1 Tax=Gorillibacterium timonense TaxID=1689269 RepID=UPI00071D2390|nr:BRO family protein [Gorillibacterium timonense]